MLATVDRILYATDLGKDARRVFNLAVSLARQYSAEIYLMHVIEPLGPTGQSLMRNVVPEKELAEIQGRALQDVRDEVHRRLTQFAQQELGTTDEHATLVSKIVIAEGTVDKLILAEADRFDADLIVIGSHGHTTVDRVLIGSVARKITQLSSVPVLLVPIPADG